MLQVVSGVPVFRDCTRSELEALRSHLHERHFLEGEIVFDEGEEGEGMYVVITGKLRAVRRGMLKKKTLGEIRPGESSGKWPCWGPARGLPR